MAEIITWIITITSLNIFGSGTDADSSKIGCQLLVQSTSVRIWITYQSVEQWKCNQCSIRNVFQNTNHIVQVNGEDNKENIARESRKNIEKIREKFQSLKNLPKNDLETSLNLAAEVGNALLAENIVLKQQVHELT